MERGFAEAMRRGEWMVTHQGIAFDVHGALVGGKHRLAAMMAASRRASRLGVGGGPTCPGCGPWFTWL
jgi:hypothetical protein